MTHFQKDFRVSRWTALRLLLTRRGLTMRLHIESDGAIVAAVEVDPHGR